MEPEAYSQPVVGPALRIGKAELKWEEPNSISKSAERRSKSTKHLSPVDARVVFEAGIDELTTSFMEMENFGTTAVYYSWHVGFFFIVACNKFQLFFFCYHTRNT